MISQGCVSTNMVAEMDHCPWLSDSYLPNPGTLQNMRRDKNIDAGTLALSPGIDIIFKLDHNLENLNFLCSARKPDCNCEVSAHQ